jgi:CheY-like chemotaxis protein
MTDKGTKKVFIIDDDAFLLEMYALKFTQKGYDVESVPGTMEALEKLRNGLDPDIMLVDIVMPTMDGFEFLAKVKEEGLASKATIIVLSNLGQPEDIEKGISLGASGYIIKASATPSEVVEKVEQALARGS